MEEEWLVHSSHSVSEGEIQAFLVQLSFFHAPFAWLEAVIKRQMSWKSSFLRWWATESDPLQFGGAETSLGRMQCIQQVIHTEELITLRELSLRPTRIPKFCKGLQAARINTFLLWDSSNLVLEYSRVSIFSLFLLGRTVKSLEIYPLTVSLSGREPCIHDVIVAAAKYGALCIVASQDLCSYMQKSDEYLAMQTWDHAVSRNRWSL